VPEDDAPDSESAVLLSLARIGARVVRDRIIERGYEELAASKRAASRASKPKTAR
jgi:hypothetical protein